MDIIKFTKEMYKQYGQSKNMDNSNNPCFFLQRKFKEEQDLLIIFKTLPCHSNCKYCNLKNNNYGNLVSLCEQFAYVIKEMRHSLSVLDRITLSNNGSILNTKTVPMEDLILILSSINQIRNISKVVIETDLKYVNKENISQIKNALCGMKVNILTGFETFDEKIMLHTLGKYRNNIEFEKKLDLLATENCEITTYILYKPDQFMDDKMAYDEALISISYLENQCDKRGIPLTIRINPMFAAKGTPWADIARNCSQYTPPKLSDIFSLAKEIPKHIPVYIGLSLEGKSESWGTYRMQSDMTKELLLDVIHFNTNGIKRD